MHDQTITIAGRFRGPPASGNGGYVGGAFAELLIDSMTMPEDHAPEVTLRSPVPLDTPLAVRRASGALAVHHGETLIAEVKHAPLAVSVSPAPAFAAARDARPRSFSLIRGASRRFPGRMGVHPVCFCCGAEHGDGLEVYAAPLGEGIVAAAWETRASWAAADGNLPARFLWTALDCPGQFAYHAAGIRTGMLGRLCARILRPIPAGERCVVTGWRIGIEGRRHYAGTAVFDARGTLCAYAKAIWVGPREASGTRE